MKNHKTFMFVLVLMFISLFEFALAESVVQNDDRDTVEFSEHDFELINNSLNYLGFDENDRVYYTDFVEIENQDSVASILYDGERIIGEYVKYVDDSETYESFIINNSEVLYDLFTNERPSINGEIVNLPKSYAFRIEDEEILMSATAQDQVLWDRMSSSQASYFVSIATEGKLLLVSNVSNSKNSTTGAGLCWAASGASIVNYIRGTNYNAISMYNKVNGYLSGTPTGTLSVEKAMFDLFLLNYNVVLGKLTYSQTLNVLKSGSPIFCSMSSSSAGHAVVLCGAFRMSASYGYLYMDSNVSNAYVLNYLDYSIISNSSTVYSYFSGDSTDSVYTISKHQIYNFSKK